MAEDEVHDLADAGVHLLQVVRDGGDREARVEAPDRRVPAHGADFLAQGPEAGPVRGAGGDGDVDHEAVRQGAGEDGPEALGVRPLVAARVGRGQAAARPGGPRGRASRRSAGSSVRFARSASAMESAVSAPK